MYARKLTKSELLENGITNVTPDARVFKDGEEVTPTITKQGYFMHALYELDENGERVVIPNEKSLFGYVYKTRSVGLHRLMWAWFNGEVPDGMVVDHINNKHRNIEDYYLENLQCITPAQNLAKDRKDAAAWHQSEIKCKLNKPRSFYQDKLEGYILAYEQAKKDHDAEAAHKLRANIAQTRARLRYYDKHIVEALELRQAKEAEEVKKQEYHERALKKKELKAKVDSARKFYKELKEAYGEDDPITKQYWGEWKLAIATLHWFCAEISAEA